MTDSSGVVGEVLWETSAARIAASNLARFSARHGFAPTDYSALHAWSVAAPEAFYSDLWDFTGVLGDKGPIAFLPDADLTKARFFPEARLNYAENLLR